MSLHAQQLVAQLIRRSTGKSTLVIVDVDCFHRGNAQDRIFGGVPSWAVLLDANR